MRNWIFFILIIGFAGLLRAEGNGGYAGAYLRIGLGARGMSMGNAQVASAEDGFGLYYNPASLPYMKSRSANMSYSFLSLDRRFNYLGYSTPVEPKGAPRAGLSIGWIYSGVTDIDAYNSIGEKTGSFDQGLHAFYLSFGIMIIPDRLSVGLSGKYLLEKMSGPNGSFDYTGEGAGADLGVLLKAFPWLSVGYQVKDINAKLRSNTDQIFERGRTLENKFPISNRAGFYAITPLKWLRAAYDFEWSNAGQEKNHFGAEAVLPGAALRAGYDNDHLTLGAGATFAAGFGITATLNYAFVNSAVDEGVSHIFSWEFSF